MVVGALVVLRFVVLPPRNKEEETLAVGGLIGIVTLGADGAMVGAFVNLMPRSCCCCGCVCWSLLSLLFPLSPFSSNKTDPKI